MPHPTSPAAINSAPKFEAQGSWSDGYRLARGEGPGVTVGPGADNPNVFAQVVPLKAQRHFRLVARARGASPGTGKARIQCNWLDAEGKFLSTSARNFDVGEAEVEAELKVSAPEEAHTAVVYVAPGGKTNVVRYLEMSVYPDFEPAVAAAAARPPRFPTHMIHLSDPETRENFGNLFRGYDDEAIFKDMIARVLPNTMVTYDGLCGLLSIVRYCEQAGIGGDYVEIGSWRGGCSGLMALGARHYGDGTRHIRVYDSFQGLPEPIAGKDFDGYVEKMFDVDESRATGKLEPIDALVAAEDDVRELLFRNIGYPEERVSICKGWFQDTIPASVGGIDSIAVLRLDGDFYDSYKIALEHLFPKVAKGGFVIIDDWVLGGCKKAVTEYFEANGLNPFLWTLDATTRCFQRT